MTNIESLQETHNEPEAQLSPERVEAEGSVNAVEMTEAQVEQATESAMALEAILDISTRMTNAGIEATEIIKVLEQFMTPADSESSQ